MTKGLHGGYTEKTDGTEYTRDGTWTGKNGSIRGKGEPGS